MVESVSKYLVYALVDPRTGQWRYIGKSSRGLKRPNEHIKPSFLKCRTRRNGWLKGLLKQDLKPVVEILEELPSNEAALEAEMEWIAAARAGFVNLTNQTDGGEGTTGAHWTLTAESRAKISAVQIGKKASLETKARMSAAQMGRVISDSHKAALSVFKSERPILLPERSNLSRSHGGRPFQDQFGRVYVSYTDAAEKLGIKNWGSVRDGLKGRRKLQKHDILFTYIE